MNPDSQPLLETTCRNCGNPIIGQRNNYSFGTYDNWWHTTEEIVCYLPNDDGWAAMERLRTGHQAFAQPIKEESHE